MAGASLESQAGHRAWLRAQADSLLGFFERGFVSPDGGFYDLDDTGKPLNPDGQIYPIHIASRAVHCYAIASLLKRPGAGDIVDHGMKFIWNRHRDQKNGGYFWSIGKDGPADTNKQGYGHAFVLLAASSAKVVGHPLADRMLADITEVLNSKFWEEQHGAIAEEFTADWQQLDGGTYRGQNSNMHLTEALMAAYEATGNRDYLTKAERISDLVIRRIAGSLDWRVAEHFDVSWNVDKTYYHPNEMFRPAGTTPGHALEWARLVLQLWVLGGKKQDWMPEAAKGLFAQAVSLGWDKARGGFFYTLDWENQPDKRQKLWWPACEAAAAAHFLNEHAPSEFHTQSYKQIWELIDASFIDHKNGGWHEELTEDLKPSHELFPGKGDVYHALQACLIPLQPATGSLTRVIPEAGGQSLTALP